VNRKTRVLLGIFFGLAMALVYTFQITSMPNYDPDKLPLAIGIAILAGALAGFLFIGIMWLISRKWARDRSEFKVAPGEEIQFSSAATRFHGTAQFGGKLYLSNRQLVFSSHDRATPPPLAIPLEQLEEATLYDIPGVGRDGLEIRFQNSHGEKFFTTQSAEWVEKLQRIISQRMVAG
jgi:hypothetical protein